MRFLTFDCCISLRFLCELLSHGWVVVPRSHRCIEATTMATANGTRRRPSIAEVGKMKVQELRDTLKDVLGELEAYDETEAAMDAVIDGDETDGGGVAAASMAAGGGGIKGMLQLILNELRSMRAERQEIKHIRQEYETLKNAVMQQQAFLEQVDTRDRERNVIITGVPEADDGDLEGASSDNEKCDMILRKIGISDVKPQDVTRLGKPQADKTRPILMSVTSRAERDKVLAETKSLKNAGQEYKIIYLKKDIHPAIRKEWKRIRDAERDEKQKPENQGSTIQLDFKSRELRRDGVVIDRWSPVYFH